jgi:lysyl-tRNA synthetase class 2
VQATRGTLKIEYQGQSVDFGKPVRRLTMAQSIVDHTDLSAETVADPQRLRAAAEGMNIPVEADWGHGKIVMEVFEARVEERLLEPTFITAYPAEVSPLARRNDDDADVTDRFELFIGGREIANAFSELNDPDDQADRFRAQAERISKGDVEAMHYDADYITALEYGLPPTAGEGFGIDRFVMLLTDSPSIRDVLLFPHMRSLPPGQDS